MIELKPCPFCGQQPEVEVWSRGVVIAHRNCPVGVDSFSDDPNGDGFGVYFSDLESAARAWNTRAERTCRMDYVGYIGTEESRASIYQCSKCNMRYMSANVPDPGEYCMECGAKVVEE